jgi:hypothetical protein
MVKQQQKNAAFQPIASGKYGCSGIHGKSPPFEASIA